MDAAAVRKQLADLNDTLATMERSLAAQDIPLDIVADFKSSIDDLRLRLWGLLTARDPDDQLAFQHRFRLRRTREMCLQVESDLRERAVAIDREELRMLAVATRGVAAAATEILAAGHTIQE